MMIIVQALLEDAIAKIVSLTTRNLSDCLTQLAIINPGFAGRL
jgi:hypothetical protein